MKESHPEFPASCLGSLSPIAVKLLGSEGRHAKICAKIPLSTWWFDEFIKISAIVVVDRHFGYKRGNVPGLTLVKEVPKTVF
jgi:hypothetical protein